MEKKFTFLSYSALTLVQDFVTLHSMERMLSDRTLIPPKQIWEEQERLKGTYTVKNAQKLLIDYESLTYLMN